MKALPSSSLLRERLNYFPETGDLIWRKPHPKAYSIKPGDPFGAWKTPANRTTKSYCYGNVDGSIYMAHRLIWVWMTGEDPGDMLVDHIDRDSRNQRWSNLRLATKSENNANTEGHSDRKNKFKGIYQRGKRFYGQARRQGVLHATPGFLTIEEAKCAYDELVTTLDKK